MPRKPSGEFDQKEYIKEYIKDNIVYKRINFNRGDSDDMAMVAWLESRDEKISNYLKRLISEDMKKSQNNA